MKEEGIFSGTVEVVLTSDFPLYWVLGNTLTCSQQVAGIFLGYLPVLIECLLSCAQARQVCRRDSLYPPRYLVITVVDRDTIKGTLFISAVIHTAANILCEMSNFKRNCMFCVIASVAWLV